MNTLKTEIKEKGVFVITLNRPKVLNSLNKEIIDELLEAFDKAYIQKKETGLSPIKEQKLQTDN